MGTAVTTIIMIAALIALPWWSIRSGKKKHVHGRKLVWRIVLTVLGEVIIAFAGLGIGSAMYHESPAEIREDKKEAKEQRIKAAKQKAAEKRKEAKEAKAKAKRRAEAKARAKKKAEAKARAEKKKQEVREKAKKKAEAKRKAKAEKKQEKKELKAAQKRNEKKNFNQLKADLKNLPSKTHGAITHAELNSTGDEVNLYMSDDALNGSDAQLKSLTHEAWKVGVVTVRRDAPYAEDKIDPSAPDINVFDEEGDLLGETSGWTGGFKFKG